MSSVIVCKAAVVWEADGPWKIETVEVSPPGPKEVRIKVAYSGVCHSDLILAAKGTQRHFPFIPGHEASGVVESVGPGVTRVVPGDHVIPSFMPRCHDCKYCRHPDNNLCERGFDAFEPGLMADGTARFKINGKDAYMFSRFSSFSQYTVVPEEAIAKVNKKAPLNKIFYLACGFPTGYGASVNTGKIKKGDTVAIFGGGGVGLAAILGAHNAGAKRLFLVDTNPKKFDLAKKLGATDCINPKDYKKPVKDVLMDLTNGGVDVSVNCTGNSESMQAAFECVHKGWGRAVLVGLSPNNIQTQPLELLYRSWKGSLFGDYTVDDIPKLVEQYLKGDFDLDPFISKEYSLDNVNDAIAELRAGDIMRNVVRMDN